MVTPAPPGSLKGNRVTAERWAGILRELGHPVILLESWEGEGCDLLLALHARRSYPSVDRFRRTRPDTPLIVGLTGTDVYSDIQHDCQAQRSLRLADRLVTLQPEAIEELPAELRCRARVIYQSARALTSPTASPTAPVEDAFEVSVVGHLRAVKDPLRTAEAARLLPASSRIRVLHAGAALDEAIAERARAEEASNPRYRWLGEIPHPQAMELMARSQVLCLTSEVEGGANVISEALVVGTPVVASRIPGSVGLLEADYPGFFPPGDTAALAQLLHRVETDRALYAELEARRAALAPRFHPEAERRAWQELLAELGL